MNDDDCVFPQYNEHCSYCDEERRGKKPRCYYRTEKGEEYRNEMLEYADWLNECRDEEYRNEES